MKNKIVVFGGNIYGVKILELKKAAKELRVRLDLISYSEMFFKTKDGKVMIGKREVNDYDVYFFRNTKRYWEEVSLILDQLDEDKKIIDPMVKSARPSDACKAYQMLVLSQSDLPVPKTIYGGLDFLKNEAIKKFDFPLIIKGSRGDRRSQVFKLYDKEDFETKIEELKLNKENIKNKYMLQEYVVNEEEYRIMIVGNKVLGIVKKTAGVDNPNLRNQFIEVDLPDGIKKLAVEAARVCGIAIAGVDVVFRNDDLEKPLFYEVNKTPGYTRFVEATGVNVAKEIVEYLSTLE